MRFKYTIFVAIALLFLTGCSHRRTKEPEVIHAPLPEVRLAVGEVRDGAIWAYDMEDLIQGVDPNE